MNKRDRAIIEHLKMFRVLSRDQIIELHFKHLKNPVNSCNSVLKRLTRDKRIKCSKFYSPYVYFDIDSRMKPDSQKIPHFLELADTVIEMMKIKEPKYVMIEPKYGKGSIEPDIFAIWGSPLFIEVQRTLYTDEVMQKKIHLYEEYYFSRKWEREGWQTENRKTFPSILIITPTRYAIASKHLAIYQAPSITDFITSRGKSSHKTMKSKSGSGIRFKLK